MKVDFDLFCRVCGEGVCHSSRRQRRTSILQLSFIANSVVYRCFRYSAPHAMNSTLLLVV
jgi:hypothetical protein